MEQILILLFLFIFVLFFQTLFVSTTATSDQLDENPGHKGNDASIESQDVKKEILVPAKRVLTNNLF